MIAASWGLSLTYDLGDWDWSQCCRHGMYGVNGDWSVPDLTPHPLQSGPQSSSTAPTPAPTDHPHNRRFLCSRKWQWCIMVHGSCALLRAVRIFCWFPGRPIVHHLDNGGLADSGGARSPAAKCMLDCHRKGKYGRPLNIIFVRAASVDLCIAFCLQVYIL